MTRRYLLALAALPVAIAQTQPRPANARNQDMYEELLKTSLESKKGLTFYVKGQTIAGVVTKIAEGWVEARSQQFSKIVIRLDMVDAITMA